MNSNDFLDILDKGVDYWNRWRKENPNIIPDLSNLILSETRAGHNDKTIKLEERNLEGINFKKVNLSKSTLRGIKLRNANLVKCNFYRSDLRKADLSESNLSNARLSLSNLTLTNLNNANLTNALFWETAMSRTNFYGVKGLETCKHGGPSLIDVATVRRSKKIPNIFLRGTGLSDELIKEFNLATNNFNSCFISYSHKDEEFVLKLWEDLQKKGIRCWYAPKDLNFGDKFRDKIEDAIQSYDKLIIVLSINSINSGWIEDEIETVMEKEYLIKKELFIPVRIDDFVWDSNTAWSKKIKRSRHIGDFTEWRNKNKYLELFDKLTIALK